MVMVSFSVVVDGDRERDDVVVNGLGKAVFNIENRRRVRQRVRLTAA